MGETEPKNPHRDVLPKRSKRIPATVWRELNTCRCLRSAGMAILQTRRLSAFMFNFTN